MGPNPWGDSKGKVKILPFDNMVMLHIKLNGIRYAAHGNKYFARISPPPNPRGGLNWSKFNFFLKHGRVVYHI